MGVAEQVCLEGKSIHFYRDVTAITATAGFVGPFSDLKMTSPAQTANVIGNDNIVVQVVDSVVSIVRGPRPYLRLTQYERRTELAAKVNSEAGLLSAYRADIVKLIGRGREMNDLRSWLDLASWRLKRALPCSGRSKTPVSCQRRGKTRLATLELARALRGWRRVRLGRVALVIL